MNLDLILAHVCDDKTLIFDKKIYQIFYKIIHLNLLLVYILFL